MSHETLFGHLAHRFIAQRENLATEGLVYVLKRSAAARAAVVRLMADAGAPLPANLTFDTQAAGEDQAIPDIVGRDENGRQQFIGEAKFWAGLTAAQPVEYIRRLEREGGRVLAVIAPEVRLKLLWSELSRRCEDEGIRLSEPADVTGGIIAGDIDPGMRLVLVSWRMLIGAVRSSVDAAGEDRLVADIVQLQGLSERMDAEAFLPLSSEELTGSLARRVIQFNQLVGAAYAQLADKGVADGSGLRSSGGAGWFGRYCRIAGVPALLHANMFQWGTKAHTPIWLLLASPPSNWKSPSPEVRRALQPLFSEGVQIYERPDGYDVPILLPYGVEWDGVVAEVIEQLERVADLLRPLGYANANAEAPVTQDLTVAGEDAPDYHVMEEDSPV